MTVKSPDFAARRKKICGDLTFIPPKMPWSRRWQSCVRTELARRAFRWPATDRTTTA